MDKIKLAYASATSAALTIIYVTAVAIYADLVAPFKNLLSGFTGHHWITKSLSSFGLYLLAIMIIYAARRRAVSETGLNKAVWFLFVTAIVGSMLIVGFYVWHFFK